MAVCRAVPPLAGGALDGGLDLGAGTRGVIAGVLTVRSGPDLHDAQHRSCRC
jgi:hypothetical protein